MGRTLPLALLTLSLVALGVTYTTPAAGLARLGLGLSLALLVASHLTPVVAQAALRFGIVDRPDGNLKTHARAVPYLGGLAVGLAFFMALTVLFRFDQRMTGILLAGAVALLLGLVDDLGSLTWQVKLAGQMLAVVVLLKSGVMLSMTWMPLWANVAVSALWLLALTNAFNLIDISDGLAPGVAMFASGAFVVAAVFDGAALLAILAATLFGALAGFLPHNAAPARIYLGDAGALFLGITLGGISMAGSYTAASRWGLLAPVLILAVPIFDTSYVVLLRLAKGKSPFLGSPDHLAVRLRRLGWSASEVAVAGCMMTVVTSAAGLTLMVWPPAGPWIVGLTLAALVGVGGFLARVDVDSPGAVPVVVMASDDDGPGTEQVTPDAAQARP